MPTVNLYLSEDEYVKLAHLAIERKVKTTELVRRAVQEYLQKEGK